MGQGWRGYSRGRPRRSSGWRRNRGTSREAMIFRIVSIADRGNKDNERLHIAVDADSNALYCAVFDTVYAAETGNVVVTPPRATYWFTPQVVKAGDNMILYTRAGQRNSALRADGKSDHFFFW